MKYYIDTSVLGGYWSKTFAEDTIAFFEYVKNSNSELLYSDLVEQELEKAPKRVRELLKETAASQDIRLGFVNMSHQAEALAERYIEEGALTEKSRNDAKHIALATTHGVSALVSWNFKHMVNFIRIRHYNSINIRLGYNTIDIRSPKEVIP